jgi:hypothetical protein
MVDVNGDKMARMERAFTLWNEEGTKGKRLWGVVSSSGQHFHGGAKQGGTRRRREPAAEAFPCFGAEGGRRGWMGRVG